MSVEVNSFLATHMNCIAEGSKLIEKSVAEKVADMPDRVISEAEKKEINETGRPWWKVW